jgi:hypothetical protein
MEVDAPSDDVSAVVRFIAGNDYFYLNLSMASRNATADAASGLQYSTIVTTMARNGTEFGIRVSGTGKWWFTSPSGEVRPLFRPGYRREDANPDLGDSTTTEMIGLGGFVMAAAPAIGHFAGTTAEDAVRATLNMYQITWTGSTNYRGPALGDRGSLLGIDCRKVVSTGIGCRQHRHRAPPARRGRHRPRCRQTLTRCVRGGDPRHRRGGQRPGLWCYMTLSLPQPDCFDCTSAGVLVCSRQQVVRGASDKAPPGSQ